MIALLTSRLAGPIATGAAILLAMALAVQTFRIADLKDQRDDRQEQLDMKSAELVRCQDGRAALQTALGEVQAAVAALKTQREAMRQAQASALAEAAPRSAEARERAERIRVAVPAVGATDCDAAGTLASQILFGER